MSFKGLRLPFERTTNNQPPDISIYKNPYLHPAVRSFRAESLVQIISLELHWLLVVVNEYLVTITLSIFSISKGLKLTQNAHGPLLL